MIFGGNPAGEHIELSADYAEQLAALFGWDEPPATLWDWWLHEVETMSARDWTPTPEDLYRDGSTRHEVHVDGGVRYATSANGALSAAAMESADPVTVLSAGPVTDEAVTVEIGDDGVSVAPETAVVSFGLPPESRCPEPGTFGSTTEWGLETAGDEAADPTEEHGHASASPERYDAWAADADGVTTSVDAAKLARLHHRLCR